MDFPVETVVALEGSTGSGNVTPAASNATANSSNAAAAPSVSEVLLPILPAVSDAKSDPAPTNHSSPLLQTSAPLSPDDQPVNTEESQTLASTDAEAQDASQPDRRSSSPTNDVTCEVRLTEAETSSQPRDASDETAASPPASELS